MPDKPLVSLISPHFCAEKLDAPTTEDLIDVFEDRVRYWVLEPAWQLLPDPFGQVASFSLLLSYFEAIWIYRTGSDSRHRSGEFFKQAFEDVFLPSNVPVPLLERVAQVLYKDARCGFFHDGLFRDRIFFVQGGSGSLAVSLPKVNGVVDQEGAIESIVVDPQQFYRDVDRHFKRFVDRLRQPTETTARENFVAACRMKWDFEGRPRRIALE